MNVKTAANRENLEENFRVQKKAERFHRPALIKSI